MYDTALSNKSTNVSSIDGNPTSHSLGFILVQSVHNFPPLVQHLSKQSCMDDDFLHPSRSSPTYERKRLYRISPISTYLLLKCGSMTGSNAFASCTPSVLPHTVSLCDWLGERLFPPGQLPNFASVGRRIRLMNGCDVRPRINLWSNLLPG